MGLKYSDPDKPARLILNRQGVFVPPHDGWTVEGRVYTVNERSYDSSHDKGETKCSLLILTNITRSRFRCSSCISSWSGPRCYKVHRPYEKKRLSATFIWLWSFDGKSRTVYCVIWCNFSDRPVLVYFLRTNMSYKFQFYGCTYLVHGRCYIVHWRRSLLLRWT